MSAAATSPAKWRIIAQKKKAEQFARIPSEWLLKSSPSPDTRTYIDIPAKSGILSAEELKITEEYDATALAEEIRQGRLKCVDVTRAFCKVRIVRYINTFPFTYMDIMFNLKMG